MLILRSGVHDPVFKKKYIYFSTITDNHKNYNENIRLTEQSEH